MKLSQLLGGVAAVALIGGAASAQVTQSAGATGIPAQIVFPSEINLANAKPAGSLNIRYDTTAPGAAFGGLGATDRVLVRVNLTGMNFTRTVGSGDWAEGTDATDCDASVVAGGGVSDNFVTFELAAPIVDGTAGTFADAGECVATDLGANLPVEIVAAGATFSSVLSLKSTSNVLATLNYDSQTTGNTTTDPLVYQSALLAAAPAFSTAGADADVVAARTLSSSSTPQFAVFNVTGADASTSTALLGTFQLNVNTTADVDNDGAAENIVDLTAGYATAADIADLLTANSDYTVTVQNRTGIASIAVGGNACTFANATALSCTVSNVAAAALDDDAVILTVSGAATVAEQSISASFSPDLATNATVPAVASGALAGIAQDDGLDDDNIGTFRWVSEAGAGTATFIRVSGLSQIPTSITATLSNASAGASFNGACNIPVRASQYANGEYRIEPADIGACGSFGRADMSIVMRVSENDNLAAANSDRVLVTSFGFSDF